MGHHPERRQGMDVQDFFAWRATSSTTTQMSDDELVADVEEPPENISFHRQTTPGFHKSTIRPQNDRKESLLTKALQPSPVPTIGEPEIHKSIDLARRRSTISTGSAASTADLTSDGGITSPARTNTPSPPFPTTPYMSFAPYKIAAKAVIPIPPPSVKTEFCDPVALHLQMPEPISKPDPAVEALVKKRCITFACGGQKPKAVVQPPITKTEIEAPVAAPAPKRCTIKFACAGPKPSERTETAVIAATLKISEPVKALEPPARNSRSPSATRKPRPSPSPRKTHRDSTSTIRQASKSPTVVRSRKPTYIAANEATLRLSEATRFHEFASDEVQEDDWIARDNSESKQKLTINDTLKKEMAIRQIGKEAEDEALREEEDEEAVEDSDDEAEEDEDHDDDEDEDEDEDDDITVEGSDDDEDASDGNETDNEAGFADSDDESDTAGDYQFWIPGRPILNSAGEANTFRTSARRTASESSIDSLKHMSPVAHAKRAPARRPKHPRTLRIRPGTPDLPDSTDFVCGTLDEDRPLEEAYVSCMEARKREKHHLIPQDIDPSFPTSDPEDEDEDLAVQAGNNSDEPEWLHGKFESDEEDNRSRRRGSRKSPLHSPKRLHSPPPPKRHASPAPTKSRHRSPPPRRLFGHSPKHMRSPPPARFIHSPPASPTTSRGAISFAPLGRRPGLTHTKSLPRKPDGFCQAYRAARLATVNDVEGDETTDGHTRGAIDIVKGLERKRQRRKEKFFAKMCNRARKGQNPERKAQPGRGAERMKELGLHMAGKVEYRNGQAEYVLSV